MARQVKMILRISLVVIFSVIGLWSSAHGQLYDQYFAVKAHHVNTVDEDEFFYSNGVQSNQGRPSYHAKWDSISRYAHIDYFSNGKLKRSYKEDWNDTSRYVQFWDSGAPTPVVTDVDFQLNSHYHPIWEKYFDDKEHLKYQHVWKFDGSGHVQKELVVNPLLGTNTYSTTTYSGDTSITLLLYTLPAWYEYEVDNSNGSPVFMAYGTELGYETQYHFTYNNGLLSETIQSDREGHPIKVMRRRYTYY